MHFTQFIDPPVFAHRGACRYAPENTIAAFLKAKQLGIRWLEFDVMLSADEQVVVIHDETLDRTTDGSGYVCDVPYDELKLLDAGSWFGAEFSKARIPLFSDVIRFMREHQMAANVEIKALPGKEKITAKKVLDIIYQFWTPDMTPPIVSSFSLTVLEAIRYYHSECWLGLLMHEWLPEWKSIAEQLHCLSVHLNQEITNREKIIELKSSDKQIFCYTVNDATRANELFSWGVDAVYSDCPEKIL
jgi:glycerophosphoryl diester phosphodiesterase